MDNFKSFISKVGDVLSPSKGAFSGAMDVIVITQPTGGLACSPFYVKFGRFKLPLSSKKKVDVFINSVQTGITMELQTNGRARFYRGSVSSQDTISTDTQTPFKPDKDLTPTHIASDENIWKSENIDDNKPSKSYEQFDYTLSSDELRSMSLKPGLNIVHYCVRSTKENILCGKIYLWDYRSKIVISDIDGTVSKSDFLGHIGYLIGKNWGQDGVVGVYNKIRKKGYQILYLSARSIDQVDYTREYLSWFDQAHQHLPDGPVILSPNGLSTSIYREIANKAYVFKEKALEQLLKLFSPDYFPFYAGFGNRKGDALAYKAIGIDKEKIYIFSKPIKNKELFRPMKKFEDLADIIDEKFPFIDDLY
jgi:phosphatidate phosphatase PAH1